MVTAKALFYWWATVELKYHVRRPSDWDASHFKTPLAPNLTDFYFYYLTVILHKTSANHLFSEILHFCLQEVRMELYLAMPSNPNWRGNV